MIFCVKGVCLLTGVSPVTLVTLWGAQCLSSCQEESESDEQGEWQLGVIQDPFMGYGKSQEAWQLGADEGSTPLVAVEV